MFKRLDADGLGQMDRKTMALRVRSIVKNHHTVTDKDLDHFFDVRGGAGAPSTRVAQNSTRSARRVSRV